MVDVNDMVAIQQGHSKEKNFRLATVTDLFESGTAKVTFFGETDPSEKEYSYLSSYKPKVNDVVLLIPFLDTYIIAGNILYKSLPTGEGYVTLTDLENILSSYLKTEDLDLSEYALKTDLDSYYKANDNITANHLLVKADLTHRGAYIGFFGNQVATKQSVSTLTNTTEPSAIVNKLNQLINALKSYNLV